ncbi:hypothetical protein OAL67_00125 [bacterium]|nr:hypothetical protein [bacterium]
METKTLNLNETVEKTIRNLDFERAATAAAKELKAERMRLDDNPQVLGTLMGISTTQLYESEIAKFEKSDKRGDTTPQERQKIVYKHWKDTLERALSASTGGKSIIIENARKEGVDTVTLYTLYVGEIASQENMSPEALEQLELQVADLFYTASGYRYHGELHSSHEQDYLGLPTRPIMRLRNSEKTDEAIAQEKEVYREHARTFIETAKEFAKKEG